MKAKLKPFDEVTLTDKNFFNKVFNELYIPLVMFAKKISNNNQDLAEDIVQDVFANLLLKKTIFKSKISLKSYLYISVKNSFLNLQKHNNIKQLYFKEKQSSHLFGDAAFYDQILEEEVKYQLYKALDLLPNRCKKVFELSLKGLKNNEIATEMKISVATVKFHKKKGKKLLKKVLSPILYNIFLIYVKS